MLAHIEFECVRIFRFPVFSRVSASRLLCVHTIDTLFSCVDSIVYKKTPRPASRAAHVEPSAMPERGVRFSGHALVVGERRIQFECEYGCDQARAFDEPLDAVHTPSCSMVLRTSASIWSKRLHHGAPLLPWINGTPACWSRLAWSGCVSAVRPLPGSQYQMTPVESLRIIIAAMISTSCVPVLPDSFCWTSWTKAPQL